MRLYHFDLRANIDSIRRHGFCGSHAWFSDISLLDDADPPLGDDFDQLIIDIPDELIAEHEVIDNPLVTPGSHREWRIPVEVVNTRLDHDRARLIPPADVTGVTSGTNLDSTTDRPVPCSERRRKGDPATPPRGGSFATLWATPLAPRGSPGPQGLHLCPGQRARRAGTPGAARRPLPE